MSFWRSKGKSGTIATQLFMGFFALYIIGVSILVGYSMEELIGKFLPDKEVITAFNGIILYYFALEFLMRLQLQELPTLAVVPYLHLNIPKQKLVTFLNLRALISPFNLLPILLFFPFSILNISEEFGSYACIMYLLGILSLTTFNNYMALYVKRLSIVNIWMVIGGGSFLVLLALLEYKKVFSISSLSNTVFHTIAIYPSTGFLLIATGLLMYMINSSYLKNNLYIEELKSGLQKKSSTDYPFIDRFGDTGTLVALEIKLILRNKRPRATAMKGLILLMYGFLIYKQRAIDENQFGMMLFAALFMTGNLITIYGQFMFGWQGAEFDGILAGKTDMRTFIKAKFLLLSLSATFLTIVISIYGLMSWKILALQFAAYLYNIGIGTVIVLYFATRNVKRVDLSKGASFNWQGVSASSMVMALPLLLLPYLIYLPLAFLLNPLWGLAGVGLMGIAGLLSRPFWINFLVTSFKKRKYTIAAGFREHSS